MVVKIPSKENPIKHNKTNVPSLHSSDRHEDIEPNLIAPIKSNETVLK